MVRHFLAKEVHTGSIPVARSSFREISVTDKQGWPTPIRKKFDSSISHHFSGSWQRGDALGLQPSLCRFESGRLHFLHSKGFLFIVEVV